MGAPKVLGLLADWAEMRIEAIWENLLTNKLGRRVLKNTIATTITVIIATIPAVVAIYGGAAYLGAFTTVFGHPGRRFGNMAEALVFVVGGTLLGTAWASFGLYLSSLVYPHNVPAAYTIRGLFLVVALVFHGFLRSRSPRLFVFVLMLIVVTVIGLTSPATEISEITITQLFYPILSASGVLLLVNVTIFPEFSSSFLGITTIETLGETVGALRDAGKYFVDIGKDSLSEEETEDEPFNLNIYRTKTTAEKPPEIKNARSRRLRDFLLKISGKKLEIDGQEMTHAERPVQPKAVKLATLTASKGKLRAKLASCKAAQEECNFELAWAVLPPRDLKPISGKNMKKLVANTIALVGACESKYALMGDADDLKKAQRKEDELRLRDIISDAASFRSNDISSNPGASVTNLSQMSTLNQRDGGFKDRKTTKRNPSSTGVERGLKDLELIKPKKEIESGDIELLKFLVRRITKPIVQLQDTIDKSVDVVTSCLAYCYDVPQLPCGAMAPKGIELEEIDIRVDILARAVAEFDRDSALALEKAADMDNLAQPEIDVMPRMETFLISSFLLNLRQAALHTLEMLNHSRIIVEKRQARHERSRLYAPRIHWRKWLKTGGEEDEFTLPDGGKSEARRGNRRPSIDDSASVSSEDTMVVRSKDEECGHSRSRSPAIPAMKANQEVAAKRKAKARKMTPMIKTRNILADIVEYLTKSEDVIYSLKFTVAVTLVTWPAFLAQWNYWYWLNRGLWAALQLVFLIEVAIGTSVRTFTLRTVGTIVGCTWGHAAYEARNGNRFVAVSMLIIGIIPSAYLQLGTKYVKVGMVSTISMCVVALATIDHTVPGPETENYLKRLISFLIGGVVALFVELFLFPVRARDRLVESLAASIRQISEMEACLAYGIETEVNVDTQSAEVTKRFDIAKGKAQGALTAAEMFLPFCANEPRLKGSFKGLAVVYTEILYVLHAVVDRMDNMLHLRHEYGSGVLEELNEKVYPYRRNVAGAVTLVLFACHEALTTKLPLPQFLPSARLAHLRMVNRVREVVTAGDLQVKTCAAACTTAECSDEVDMVKRVVQQKFLSWNAASAGQIEVIEYLEELVDLMKLLVGANEFRSGLLTRPTYREYISKARRGGNDEAVITGQKDGEDEEGRDVVFVDGDVVRRSKPVRRRTPYSVQDRMEVLKRLSRVSEQLENGREEDEGELPRSLQRVRSRRISRRLEEMDMQADGIRSNRESWKSERVYGRDH